MFYSTFRCVVQSTWRLLSGIDNLRNIRFAWHSCGYDRKKFVTQGEKFVQWATENRLAEKDAATTSAFLSQSSSRTLRWGFPSVRERGSLIFTLARSEFPPPPLPCSVNRVEQPKSGRVKLLRLLELRVRAVASTHTRVPNIYPSGLNMRGSKDLHSSLLAGGEKGERLAMLLKVDASTERYLVSTLNRFEYQAQLEQDASQGSSRTRTQILS